MVRPTHRKHVKTIEILRAVRMNEPVTGPRLAEMFGKSRQAMYMRLKTLERKGFLERVIPSPDAPLVPALYRCSQKLRDAERRLAGKESD
jgi:DNA-binding Lrp family transcriptional regulator